MSRAQLLAPTALLFPLLFASAACSGDDGGDPTPTPTPTDAGTVMEDAGPGGPDQDDDVWLDDVDNCPAVSNPEQRDRDEDGIGDACDPCPNTPNASTTCVAVDEAEPNDTPGSGEMIAVPAAGEVAAVRGRIEAPSGGQAYDRFQIMVGGGTMVNIRVARADAESRLQPAFSVSGGAFTVARWASGQRVAERALYFAGAGVYEVSVADRRGALGANPAGASSYDYEVSFEAVPVTETSLTLPVMATEYDFADFSAPLVFSADLAAEPTTLISTESDLGVGLTMDGVDPVLILARADGTVIENADVSASVADARIVLENLAAAEKVTLVLDWSTVTGDDPNSKVRLNLEQFNTVRELEPNDTPELASVLQLPGQTAGVITQKGGGTIADVDWYRFDATAGSFYRFTGVTPGSSYVDSMFALVKARTDETYETLYLNTDDTASSPRMDALIYEDGTYYLGVFDQRNRGVAPFVGSLEHTYGIYSERATLRTETTVISSTTSVSFVPTPGGRQVFHTVQVDTPMVLKAVTTQAQPNDELSPYYRLFGAGGVGQHGQGSPLLAYLPAAGEYLLASQNALDGLGKPNYQQRVAVELSRVTAVSETEPNDTAGAADPLGTLPAVGTGELANAADVDVWSVSLDGGPVDIVLTEGGYGRTVNVADATGAPLDTGAGGVYGFTPPRAGDYTVRVSGTVDAVGPYVLVAAP